MKLWRIAVLVWFPCSLLASGLPTAKTKVAEPVLQELMGGCSLACAFPWESFVIVPGKALQPDYKLNDSDASTAWIDPNAATGTKLLFQMPKKIPPEMDGEVPFYGFDIVNGYIKSGDLFSAYSRVKRAELYYNGKPFCYVNFADTKRWQHINFDDILVRHGDTFSIEILEVYPGKKFPNVAITQLVLQGAH